MNRLEPVPFILVLLSACAMREGQPLSEKKAPPASLSSCTLELAWSSSAAQPLYGPQVLSLAPRGALLRVETEFGAHMARVRDGAPLTSFGTAEHALDREWKRSLDVDHAPELSVLDVRTQQVLARYDAPSPPHEGWIGRTIARFLADGSVLAVDCWRSNTDARGETAVRHLGSDGSDGSAGAPIPIPASCPGYLALPSVLEDPASNSVIISGFADGAVARVDLALGKVSLSGSFIGPPVRSSGCCLGDRSALSTAIAANGKTLAVSGRDGLVHLVDPTTLLPAAALIPAGIHQANLDTYLPSAESPVALSADGSLLAHVDAGRRVVLRSLAESRVLGVLETELPRARSSTIATPMGILMDEVSVTVAYDRGVARWACAGSASSPADESPLSIDLDPAPSLVRGMKSRVHVRVAGGADPIVRRVSVGGRELGPATLADTIDVYPETAGQTMLEVKADDGIEETSRAIAVDVAP